MKTLLVPTDFSNEAENAVKVAAQLAKNYDCKIILLNMLELPFNQLNTDGHSDNLPEAMYFMKLAHKKFEEVLTRDYLKGVDVVEMVNFNDIAIGILEACKKENVDLIIMGSHGADGLKELFIGSNTEKVVRTSNTPVLVIKNQHNHFDIKEFVFASDFKNDNKETYKQAVKLANEFIAGNTFDNYTINIYNDETVEKGVLNFSKIINADLIGISTHGRQGIAHFFNGSISEDLVNHAKRPVITFKI